MHRFAQAPPVFLLWIALASALPILAGCGPAKPPIEPYPVKGRVLYVDQPAAGVVVFLLPVTAPVVPDIPSNPRGVTDANGEFSLSTFGEGDGAPEGSYVLVMRWPPDASEGRGEGDQDKFLGWYDGAHSKLNVRVKAGENVVPTIKVDRITAPPHVSRGVPGKN